MFRCRSAWGPGKLLLSLTLACLVTTARAESSVQTFDIPAQPVAAALRALATQAGIQIVFTPEVVGSTQAKALRGRMSVDEAIDRLLAGTGLKAHQDGAGNYVLSKATTGEANSMLSEMVVTATRTERRIEEVPASVSVISSRDIATQQPRQLADLLRNVEGVDVAGYGSPASLPSVILRGVGGSFGGQTSQILIDSLPIESPVAGIHLGSQALDLFDLERVEILRGAASALYGPSAVGGVVNYVPKRWQGAPGGEVSLGGGSHGATQLAAAVGGAWDVIDFRLSSSDYQTEGYKPRRDADPWGAKDLNSREGDASKLGLTVGVRPAGNQELTLSARSSNGSSDWLGGHPNYRFDNDADSYDLGYRYEAGAWGVFKARYRHTRQRTHILFDDEQINGNVGSLALAEVDDRVEDSDYLDLQADLQLNQANTLILGYAHGSGKYTSRWRDVIWGGSGENVSKSTVDGVFLQDEYHLSEALSLLAGGRWDRYKFGGDTQDGVATGNDSEDSVFNPRLGGRYKLNNQSSIYATVGTAYVPALNSLKFHGGATWLDNPDLQPETSTSYEVGADHRRGNWSMRAALFHTDYEDKISSIRVGSRWQFQNIGKVAIDGVELAVEGAQGDWHPYANYTYTDSRIKRNPSDPLTVGKQVQRVAPNKFNVGVTYAPTERFYARVAGRYVDAYYFNDRNTADARNPGHFVADAKIGWQLPPAGLLRHAEISLAINNLFDRRYREQQYDYADGRNVWLGLAARF
jgi:outer membrane receptor protein involved in Fe transport